MTHPERSIDGQNTWPERLHCDDGLSVIVTSMLADFRQWLEEQLDEPLAFVDLNGALLLSNLCEYLGLDDSQRAQVLGPDALQSVHRIEADHLSFATGHIK